MRIAIAQIRPFKGDISRNITKHKAVVEMAVSLQADAIFFPELSLTGYEPTLANELATVPDDSRFNTLQEMSNASKICIGVGVPIRTQTDIMISMIVFRQSKPPVLYSKQLLHEDEKPFFIAGREQIILSMKGEKIAPAICYESLQPEHSLNAKKIGASVYLASVAKSKVGIQKALLHFPKVARAYAMPVLMSNSVGPCDNFEAAGASSVWSIQGKLLGQLDHHSEGVLFFDKEAEKLIAKTI